MSKETRGVPDAIHHTDTSETLEYITGWNDCRQAMLAEEALNKMAENARDLGLDYEPAQQEPVPENFMDALKFDVAMRDACKWERIDMREHAEGNLGIGTAPPQAQRTWVGLTDAEVEDFVSALWPVGAGAGKLLRAIEEKLKEKNT